MFFSSVVNSVLSVMVCKDRHCADSLSCVLDEATVVLAIAPKSVGRVLVHGVYWKAKSVGSANSAEIVVGQTVVIDYRKGLTLYVHPVD